MITGTKQNKDRKKKEGQFQWLLSLPDEQQQAYKDYLLDNESVCAVIKKFKHTYKDISPPAIQNLIDNNPHIKSKENQNISKLNKEMVLEFLSSKKLEYVEYSEVEEKKRILIRDKREIEIYDSIVKKSFKGNICIVFNLLNQAIITTYFNEITDNHSTRDKNKLEKASLNITFDEETKELIVKDSEESKYIEDYGPAAQKLPNIKVVSKIELRKK